MPHHHLPRTGSTLFPQRQSKSCIHNAANPLPGALLIIATRWHFVLNHTAASALFLLRRAPFLELSSYLRWQTITNAHRHLLLVGRGGDPWLLMATSDGEFELWQACLSPVEVNGSHDQCSNIRLLNVSLLCKIPGWAPDLPDPLLVSPSVSTRRGWGGGVKSYFRHNQILPSL